VRFPNSTNLRDRNRNKIKYKSYSVFQAEDKLCEKIKSSRNIESERFSDLKKCNKDEELKRIKYGDLKTAEAKLKKKEWEKKKKVKNDHNKNQSNNNTLDIFPTNQRVTSSNAI